MDQPIKQWLTGEKREEDKNTNIWISREQKELFRWNKKNLSKFLKGYHSVKNKKINKIQRTQALKEHIWVAASVYFNREASQKCKYTTFQTNLKRVLISWNMYLFK